MHKIIRETNYTEIQFCPSTSCIRTPALVLGPHYADHANQWRKKSEKRIWILSRITTKGVKGKKNTAKEMETERPLGMKCILMLCIEGETWREPSGKAEGGKKLQIEKNGRSRF